MPSCMGRESSRDGAAGPSVTFRGTGWGLPEPLHLASPARILEVDSDSPGDLQSLLLELDVLARSGRPDQLLAGFLSYEAGVYLEGSRRLFRPPQRTPLAWFGLFSLDQPESEEAVGFSTPEGSGEPASSVDSEGWAERIGEIREAIARGSVYQVNLTRRVTVPSKVDSDWLAARLYSDNPVPYGLHIATADFAITSNSPELFVRCDLGRRTVESSPIKGTVPRFSHPGEDARAIRSLQTSEKDLAEHVMIVDLVRNDLGRVAVPGSVRVPDLEIVKSFSHLHHLESTVKATLLPQMAISDILLAAFPGGSVTGAPKRASLSYIRNLEPVPRGPYTGAIGYVRGDGTAVFNVGIRTAILSAAGVDYHSGCGIVWDSDAAAEWEESEVKSREFARAVAALSTEGPADE